MRIINENFLNFEDLTFGEKVKEIVQVFESSRLSVGEIKKEKEGYFLIEIYGGLNGWGNWINYFNDLRNLTVEFDNNFSEVWLTGLKVDCLDDVWTATFGIRE